MFTLQTPTIGGLLIFPTLSRIEIVKHREVKLKFKWAGALKKPQQKITSKDLKKIILEDWLETD